MEKNKIGDYIKKKRKEKGYSQQKLGKLLFVTDKAVSKWERNIGLPDVAILTELAKVLDTTVSNILNGEDNTKDIDIDDKLKEIKKEINIKNRMKIIGIIILSLLVIIIVITNNISYGYQLKNVHYNHAGIKKDINIGIPKTSFMMKYNDKSYSFKNFRNKSVLENEIKKYLKTLKFLSCNDTIYYYNETDDFSITAYSVDNHILYKNITYTIANGDYCENGKINEYGEKLGGLRRIHSLEQKYENDDDVSDKLYILFIDKLDMYDHTNKFKVGVRIERYYKANNEIKNEILEISNGHYEIKEDKLYYYRDEIVKNSENITIPEVSIFKIEDTKLLLIDNYLSKYYDKQIILK